jgi:hypothetical protein
MSLLLLFLGDGVPPVGETPVPITVLVALTDRRVRVPLTARSVVVPLTDRAVVVKKG